MNGQELIENVLAAYAGFVSYTDVGTVDSLGLPGAGLEFQTYFKRPLNFRFHWLSWHPYFGKTKPANENTVWTDGKVFNRCYHGETKTSKSFSMMIAGATGVSSGSVHNILNILVPGSLELSHVWHEMTEIRLLPDEMVDGAECFHIIGTIKNSEDAEVWVEKKSSIVRRLKETIVITEETSAKMRAEQQSAERIEMMTKALKKAGLSDERIEETMTHLATAGAKPMTYSHIFNYTKVTVNQPIDDAVFTGK